jgi:hypothetical protein
MTICKFVLLNLIERNIIYACGRTLAYLCARICCMRYLYLLVNAQAHTSMKYVAVNLSFVTKLSTS